MASTSEAAVHEEHVNEILKSLDSRDEEDAKYLERMRRELIKIITSNWEDVVRIYKQDPRAHKIKLGKSGNTALHMAVASGQEDIVEQLVKLINEKSENPLDVLSMKGGDWKNNPLHMAASLGSIRMCKCIIGDKHKQLLGTRYGISAMPMYMTVYDGKKDTFLWLYEMCDNSTQVHAYCHDRDGTNVLHNAILDGYWDLAFQIIHRLEGLMDFVNSYGNSPLHILARSPTAFRSGINLNFFHKIIYSRIYVEELILDTTFKEKKKVESLCYPNNYQTCINFFQVLWKIIKLLVTGGKSVLKSNKQLDAESLEEGQGHHSRICSGHFLMLDDHLKYAAIPVYALTFLAVAYFSISPTVPIIFCSSEGYI